jgi:selenium-dependent xanthine dehydrogenase
MLSGMPTLRIGPDGRHEAGDMAQSTPITFTLDGRAVTVDVTAGTSLLDLLRDDLGLRGPKDGCAPEGSCGACTVIVDGRAVVTCAQPAERVAGRTVVTVAGLPADHRALWADGFAVAGASQCGFCSPGIVMKAEGLLRRDPTPSRDVIVRALAGNLCRCTGYHRIVDAIELVAACRRGDAVLAPIDASGAVGSRAIRYEARDLALGTKPFVADLTVPGMLHGALRFADHPRSTIRRIDVTRALAAPDVVAVVTAADVPGERVQGLIRADWPVFVAEGETTRYVGDVLAAVAATTRRAARAAAALIDVDAEVLPPVTDPFEALAEEAPAIHEGGNLLSRSVLRTGDVDAALADAAAIATETFRTGRIEHAFLEPEACLAVPDPDGAHGGSARLHLHTQGQGAWDDRRQVASLLGLDPTEVRVTQVATGGAFGGKEDLSVQGQAALLAHVTQRPVLVALSRADSLRLHPKRHPFWMDYTVGCDAEGHLVAVRARIVGDNGAYASVGMKVLERAAAHACGPYRVPNLDVEALAVHTNNPPSGAMRGFGVNQTAFAIEGMLDRLAERIGIDGWEIRWRNALETGDRFATGQRLGRGVGLKATLLAVRDAYRGAAIGGIACGVKNSGIGNGLTEYGRAILRPEADGTITLYHSWTEMGQGCHTIFAQLAASELGVPIGSIRVVVDTERELDTGQTTASRATMLGGRAVLRAAEALRMELAGRPPQALAGREFPGEVVIDWTTPLDSDAAEPITHMAFGWATQVVVLDADGRIERVVAAHDVGKVMNRTLLEGQVEGGVHMGLGQALSEEFVVRDGVPVTDTLKGLGIIGAAGMPPVETILVEEPQPEGPLGAKGVGEAVLVPTAAAVAEALYRFDGIRRTRLPMRDSSAARAAVPRLAHLMPAASDATAGVDAVNGADAPIRPTAIARRAP